MKRILLSIIVLVQFITIGFSQNPIKGANILYFNQSPVGYTPIESCCSEIGYNFTTQELSFWNRGNQAWDLKLFITALERSKLAAIEAGATGDQTAAEILALLLTVDTNTSGLNAATLDGQEGAYYNDFGNLTNVADPTITLAGDATGSVTLTNLGNGTLTLTVVDDSHNHVIANVDGLQTALDSKLASTSYTAADVLAKLLTVDGPGSGVDADLLDGVQGTLYARRDQANIFTSSQTINGEVIANGGINTNGTAIKGSPLTDLNATDFSVQGALRIHNYFSSATNKPATFDNANWLLNLSSISNYGHQITGIDTDQIYFRKNVNGTFGTWHKFYHTGNLTNSLTANDVPYWNGTSFVDSPIYTNGTNVGIGTANPSARLSLGSSIGDKLALWDDGSNKYGFGIQPDLLQIYTSGNVANIAFGYGASASMTTRMFIDNGTGNVGIGTASPTSKLEVKDGHYLSARSTNTSQTNTLLQGAGYHIGSTLYGNTSIRSTYTSGSNAASLEFYVAPSASNTSEAMRITADGNVGIGTANPSAKLHVLGTTLFEKPDASAIWGTDALLKLRNSNASDGTWAGIQNDNSAGQINAGIAFVNVSQTPNYGRIDFSERGPSGFHYSTMSIYDGKVGIGTTSPTSKLHVNGDITTNTSFALTGLGSALSYLGTHAAMYRNISPMGSVNRLDMGEGGDFTFWYRSAGNFNINTAVSAANEKLNVSGNIHIPSDNSGLILSVNKDFGLIKRSGTGASIITTLSAADFTIATTDGATVKTGTVTDKIWLRKNGNIDLSGLVDGRDVAADGAKLDTHTSGKYTPVFANTGGGTVTVTSPFCTYRRVGNFVFVNLRFIATATVAENYVLDVSLPIASNLAGNDLAGEGHTLEASTEEYAQISTDISGDLANVYITPNNTNGHLFSGSFSYEIK